MAILPSERRDFIRYDTDVPATVTSRSMRMSVKMLSVSASGALLRMDRLSAKVFDDDTFTVEILGVGRFEAHKKWRRDTDLGCKFDLSDTDRQFLADRLVHCFGRAEPKLQAFATNAPRP